MDLFSTKQFCHSPQISLHFEVSSWAILSAFCFSCHLFVFFFPFIHQTCFSSGKLFCRCGFPALAVWVSKLLAYSGLIFHMSSPCDCQEKDSARMELSETGCALHQRLSVVAYLAPVPSPCVRVPDLYICFWIQIILSLGREHNSYLKNSYFENWTFWTANGISSSFLWLHAILNLVKAYMVFTVSDLLIFLHFFHSLWVNK